ncbi:MAG: hypothetical protein Q7R33_00925 [Nitrosarchaeum sp.]|nr:hypothetical protein [Nitrosarchaeum sp.]
MPIARDNLSRCLCGEKPEFYSVNELNRWYCGVKCQCGLQIAAKNLTLRDSTEKWNNLMKVVTERVLQNAWNESMDESVALVKKNSVTG